MNFFSNYGFDAGEGEPPVRRGLVCSPTFELRPSNSQIRAMRGFSMIEIALALAVIGIALVSILGLLAVGLNSARDATDDNMAAQLVQAIIADRQSMSYDQSTPTLSETTFEIPRLDTGIFPYTLFFKKSGGLPINTGGFESRQLGYYYEVDIKKNPSASIPTGLALLDIRVSWPANMTMTNRITYFYSTAIMRK